jgi:hypothetical protein
LRATPRLRPGSAAVASVPNQRKAPGRRAAARGRKKAFKVLSHRSAPPR